MTDNYNYIENLISSRNILYMSISKINNKLSKLSKEECKKLLNDYPDTNSPYYLYFQYRLGILEKPDINNYDIQNIFIFDVFHNYYQMGYEALKTISLENEEKKINLSSFLLELDNHNLFNLKLLSIFIKKGKSLINKENVNIIFKRYILRVQIKPEHSEIKDLYNCIEFTNLNEELIELSKNNLSHYGSHLVALAVIYLGIVDQINNKSLVFTLAKRIIRDKTTKSAKSS